MIASSSLDALFWTGEKERMAVIESKQSRLKPNGEGNQIVQLRPTSYTRLLLRKVLFCLGQFQSPSVAVSSALHKGGAFSSTHLQLQHQVHSLLPKWVDVVKNQGDDNVNSIGLMGGDTILHETNKNDLKGPKIIHLKLFPSSIFVPGFHGRGPDSTQSDSPGFG